MLLAATSNVAYDWFQTDIWFETTNGKETETHYPGGHVHGSFHRSATLPDCCCCMPAAMSSCANWRRAQTILVKPTALVFKDPTVRMHLHFEHPGSVFRGWGYWSNRYLWLRLSGPGRVAIQSVFARIEGESRNMTRWSNATTARW